jgi:ElaB/YqjD/DUF883 family membrane-anchored ribosome-binding protein
MATNGYTSSAELEREVEAQRNKVESTIGEIKERLTPGQLVDEMLSYTKHGGAHFAANLGNTVSSNPLPAALLGVSLLWLMAGPKPAMGNNSEHGHADSHAHPDRGRSFDRNYRAIRGSSLQRVSHGVDDAGLWYSEWTDDGGAKYRARSDKSGNRMGDFADEAGKAFAGFFDETGNRISEFRDEAGNALDQAAGWANHTWQDVQDQVGQQVEQVRQSAMQMTRDVQQQTSQLTRSAMQMFEDQPLIVGALAFAAGAALGATLPATKQEDEMLGKVSDDVRREAGHVAADLYEQGKEKAAEVYEDVAETAGQVYEDAKNKLGTPQPGNGQGYRH